MNKFKIGKSANINESIDFGDNMPLDTDYSSADKSFKSDRSKILNTSIESSNEREKHMAPLFYFLASSLNVELVYIILKSLTQFVNINPM